MKSTIRCCISCGRDTYDPLGYCQQCLGGYRVMSDTLTWKRGADQTVPGSRQRAPESAERSYHGKNYD